MASICLFEPGNIGSLSIANRIVLAPMTRARAQDDWSPNERAAEYYGQRNSAGLVIAEATQISPDATGYVRTPGFWTDEHIARWSDAANAVHEGDAKFFVQFWHCGRIGHPDNMPPGCTPMGPSVVKPVLPIWTDVANGPVDNPAPREMDEDDIRRVINDHRQAAMNAKAAGIDGIELHAANGYLIEQFASTNTNLRTDAWGGTLEKRMRFMVEVIEAVATVFDRERIGIRFSPYGTFNEIDDANPLESFQAKLDCVEKAGLGYVHVIRPLVSGNLDKVASELDRNVLKTARARYSGKIIAAGSYTRETGEADLSSGLIDFVAFGRPFVANPDLPRRLREGLPLAEMDETKLYTAGLDGYIDYPALP